MLSTLKRTLRRKTYETDIVASLCFNGVGLCVSYTGINFFNHLLLQFVRFARLDLKLVCFGDYCIDYHHTVEDVGIVVGKLIRAVINVYNIKRFSHVIVPMDEALVMCSIDICNRTKLVWNVPIETKLSHMSYVFFDALICNMCVCLHVDYIRGCNCHHIFEAIFKAFGLVIFEACLPCLQINSSSKGSPKFYWR